MPVIDKIAQEYSDRVAFVAPAWRASASATRDRAADLLPSGEVAWGLDEAEEVFQAYAVPYQPVTVLIGADKTLVDQWAGAREESEIRLALDELIALSG